LVKTFRFEEAEPLLLSGYEGAVKQQATMPFDMRKSIGEAQEEIVKVYEAVGQPEKAMEWREKPQAKESAREKP
jgi:hypothetical protein